MKFTVTTEVDPASDTRGKAPRQRNGRRKKARCSDVGIHLDRGRPLAAADDREDGAREQKGGAMTLQRIDDLKEPPIVGRYYLVPCIKVTSAESLPVGFWPVTGPQHEDREIIGFAWRHWHYDFRFLTHAQHLRKTLDRGSVLCTAQGEHKEPGIAAEVVYKPRLCQREVLGFPAYKAHWLPQLRDAHADARVKCGKCPHRGLPLESLPREPGTDIVTCPGHGLRWDLKTGKMVI